MIKNQIPLSFENVQHDTQNITTTDHSCHEYL